MELHAALEEGSLHLLGFALPADELPDPAEELFVFLDEEGVELEEDEIEDLELAGGEAAMCEYLTEPDEDDAEPEEAEATYWLTAVAVLPGVLVFASYHCEAGEEERERDAIRKILASLRLAGR